MMYIIAYYIFFVLEENLDSQNPGLDRPPLICNTLYTLLLEELILQTSITQ